MCGAGQSNVGSIFGNNTGIVENCKALDSKIAGDVDGDYSANNTDITLLVRHLAGYDPTPHGTSRMDKNGDGKINNRDAIELIQAIAGMNE